MADNKVLVHGIYDAFGRGDIGALLGALADDIEWICEGPAHVPFCGTFRGPAGVGKFFEALGTTQSEHKLTIDATYADGDTVISTGRFAAKVNATGKRFDFRFVHVFTLKDGKVVKLLDHIDTAAAVEAYAVDNAAIVQSLYAAFGRGDIGTVLAGLTDDAEWICEGPAAVPFCGTFKGREGAAKFFQAIGTTQTDQKLTMDEFFADGDTVIAVGRYACRVNGTPYDSRAIHTLTFRDGKVARFIDFIDTADALHAYSAAPTSAATA
jgi:hypothetical protein